jgi:hypothetical protein
MKKKLFEDDSDSEESNSNNNNSTSNNKDIKEEDTKKAKSEVIDIKTLNKKRKRKKINKESPNDNSSSNEKHNLEQKNNQIKKEPKEEEKKDIFFNEDKIIFKYENEQNRIDSAFVYNNGDILIFMTENTTLYDGKTFSPKLKLDFINSLYCFCYISEEEFISCKGSQFIIYKFEKQRTSVKLCQIVNCSYIIKIKKLTNYDLAALCCYAGDFCLRVFRKKNLDECNDLNNTYNYQYILFKSIYKSINYLLEINSNEILTIRKGANQLNLIIYNTKYDYNEIKSNTIKTEINGKTRFYIISPFYKVNNFNKIISAGFQNIYIFDLLSLDVETVIKVGYDINKILCLNENYFLFTYLENQSFNNFFIKKMKIDFKYNEIVEEKKEDITEYSGKLKTLFKIEKYINNGLITIINDSLLRVYK